MAAITTPSAPLTTTTLQPNVDLPLVATPDGNGELDLGDLLAWLTGNGTWLKETLLRRGGVLIRGLPVNGPEDLEQIVKTVAGELIPYVEGQSSRTKVHDNVYTSTEYPADQAITLHNELSYNGRAAAFPLLPLPDSRRRRRPDPDHR